MLLYFVDVLKIQNWYRFLQFLAKVAGTVPLKISNLEFPQIFILVNLNFENKNKISSGSGATKLEKLLKHESS